MNNLPRGFYYENQSQCHYLVLLLIIFPFSIVILNNNNYLLAIYKNCIYFRPHYYFFPVVFT